MNYLERYRDGEYEQVWEELQALGPEVGGRAGAVLITQVRMRWY